MKHTKRLFAVLLAALLLAALAVPAMAEPTGGTPEGQIDPSTLRYVALTEILDDVTIYETLKVKYPGVQGSTHPAVNYVLRLADNGYFYERYDPRYHLFDPFIYYDFYGLDQAHLYEQTLMAAVEGFYDNLNGGSDILCVASFDANAAQYGTPAVKAYSFEGTLKGTQGTEDYGAVYDAINELEFDAPCIFYFPLTKEMVLGDDTTEWADDFTNNHADDLALLVRIDVDEDGNLVKTVALAQLSFTLTDPEDPDSVEAQVTNNKPALEDEYTGTQSLTLEKHVSGNQAPRDMYFRFTVELTWKDNLDVRGTNLTPTGDNSVHELSDYKYVNEYFKGNSGYSVVGHDNYEEQTIGSYGAESGDSSVTFTFWLKDGENVEIPGIPIGATYTVTEYDMVRQGWDVEATVDGEPCNDALGNYVDFGITKDSISDETDAVAFTNTSNTEVPTGLSLQSAAPVALAVLALGLGAVLLLGKKRRNDAA